GAGSSMPRALQRRPPQAKRDKWPLDADRRNGRTTAAMDDPGKYVRDLIRSLTEEKSRGTTDWTAAPGYVWTGAGGRPVAAIDAPRLDLLKGIDRQKQAARENVARLAAGHAAHDMLL